MRASYSMVSTFTECPFKYRLIYLEHLVPKDNLSPDNPLFVGTAIHEGIEKRSVSAAVENYMANFPELSSENNFEIEKLKLMTQKAIAQIPECTEYEYKLDIENEYVGFIDGLKKNEDGTYDIYDFKYSNNIDFYKQSPQIHIYKYYFEKLTGNVVRDLYYVFVPKSTIKLNENLNNKQAIIDDLSKLDIHFEKVQYDPGQVDYFLTNRDKMQATNNFLRRYNKFCYWCQFKKFCQTNGADTSELK